MKKEEYLYRDFLKYEFSKTESDYGKETFFNDIIKNIFKKFEEWITIRCAGGGKVPKRKDDQYFYIDFLNWINISELKKMFAVYGLNGILKNFEDYIRTKINFIDLGKELDKMLQG